MRREKAISVLERNVLGKPTNVINNNNNNKVQMRPSADVDCVVPSDVTARRTALAPSGLIVTKG
jgi:hypothetical protein